MNNDQALARTVEALLFALGKPMTRKELVAKLGCTNEELELALRHLHGREGGIVCVDDGETLELRAAPEAAELIEAMRKEELSRDIGRAGLEALSAILYRGPLSRSEIDFIRGVNSSQTLRTLLMRGLVRRVENAKDARGFKYEPTTELLAQLGVERRDELPEYASVRAKLEELEAAYRAKETAEAATAQNNDETAS